MFAASRARDRHHGCAANFSSIRLTFDPLLVAACGDRQRSPENTFAVGYLPKALWTARLI